MAGTGPDLRKTVQYHPTGARKRLLFLALALFALSFGVLINVEEDHQLPIAVAGVAAGLGWAGYEFWRLFNHGKPILVLSALGVDYRVMGGGAVFIPWSEIREVGTADVKGGRATFKKVTVLTVSDSFFVNEVEDRVGMLAAANRYLFIPKGNFVDVAIHHETIGIEPQALREAIAARWYHFHNRKT